MAVTAPYRAHLRYLRHMTLWTLLLFVGAVFVSVSFDAFGRRSAPVPAQLVLGVCAVTCGAVAVHFMIASVAPGGPPPMTRVAWIALGSATVAALVATIVATLVYTSEDEPPIRWLLAGLFTQPLSPAAGCPGSRRRPSAPS